jgi:hypothetical protein
MFAATVFGLSGMIWFWFILGGTDIKFEEKSISSVDIIVSGSLTALNAIAWLFDNPIGKLIVLDTVDGRLPSTHPVVMHAIQITSQLYLGAILLNSMILNTASVLYGLGEKETAPAFTLVARKLVVGGMILFLSFHGFYFHMNIEEIITDSTTKKKKKKRNTTTNKNNNNNII